MQLCCKNIYQLARRTVPVYAGLNREMSRLPDILLPYPGPLPDESIQDIVVYLRPQSNGVMVESTILRVIRDNPFYREHFEMIYLANIPGDFIVEKRIIEQHYALNLRFAREGKRLFSDTMAGIFEDHFQQPFSEAKVLGAFEALEALGMNEEQLFEIWVPEGEMIKIHGQTVKRYRDLFIVNYDIPALLKKNSQATDIFSMILRCRCSYKHIHAFVVEAGKALSKQGILISPQLYSHVFHYSKSPFEQILDGLGYVYTKEEQHVEAADLSFFAYLLKKGCSREEILEAVREPIMSFRAEDGTQREEHLFIATYERSFAEAFRIYERRN
jgi:hypothetical protein